MKTIAILAVATLAACGALAARAASDEGSLFISPCGKPYVAEAGQPYPVGVWFKEADLNKDGKLDQAEFRADADAFFTVLDRNKDGFIGPTEVTIYERYFVPEILAPSFGELDLKGGLGQPGMARVDMQVQGPDDIVPGGDTSSNLTPRQRLNTNQGAVQFSFFREPEPVRAADRNFDYLVSRKEFQDQADRHFKALDANGDGFVTLDELPQTPAQKAMRGMFR